MSNTTKTLAAALAVAATAMSATQAVATVTGGFQAAATPAPAAKVVAASLSLAPEIGHGMVAITFRTDHAIPRKAPKGSLLASAGLKTAQEESVGTLKAARHCYVAYEPAAGLRHGAAATVHIAIDGVPTTRRVHVRAHDDAAGVC